jgi:hypothetical protein
MVEVFVGAARRQLRVRSAFEKRQVAWAMRGGLKGYYFFRVPGWWESWWVRL